MAHDKHTFFIKSIRGKIIIASFFACLTLLLAWGISRIAFKRMLIAVEKISAPNDKLRLVNDLTHKVAQLDQIQKSEMLNNPANYYALFKETRKLLLTIDTLQMFFADDEKQVKHINSLKKLLIKRDKLFINYLKVREGLVNNKTFSSQVKMLNDLVNKSARQNDSAVTTSEKNTKTTTIISENPDSSKQSRGFFSKLFGKKKPPLQNPTYKVVQIEINTKQDTLALARRDSILDGMSRTMNRLEKSQARRSALFVDKEAVLNKANDKLIRRILGILKQVEAEAVMHVELNNNAAKNVVNTSVTLLGYIIIIAFLLAVTLLYFILRDISRINQYKKELEMARDEAEYHGQAKHRFLSNMSHEIRTPLQSIIGYAELLKQQVHPRKSDIEAIYRSSEHLMQIVDEVLDYNRIVSGKFTINNKAFNMADVLNEVVSVLRLQAAEKSLSLVTDFNIYPEDYIEGDAFRLKQILYNLMGNAIKFTCKGEVKLSVLRTETENMLNYVFLVSDTGIGLSENDIARVFDEFEQVAESGSNHLKGTGLGLTISKSLIEAQGGSIKVESELGVGSVFTFNLSYKKAAKLPEETEVQLNRLTIARQDKIWIIDDDSFILELCSAIFERNDIKHRGFSSPVELLHTAFDPAVKFILIDIRLPEMSGTELCKILRDRIPGDVLIFALTAQSLPGEHEIVLNAGFDGMLMKPFRERDLLALIMQTAVDTEKSPEIKLDISGVEKMTLGDKRQLNKILKRFTEDCIDDIAELRLSIESYDNDKLVLLVHRIAGRAAQIGAAYLAADFRVAEINFSNNNMVNTEKIDTIILLTNKLQTLVKQVRTVYLSEEVPEAIT